MLTAFSYYDLEEENRVEKGYKNNDFFEKELSIAKELTSKIKGKRNDMVCPMCGGEMLPFFSKWDVEYYRCKNCYSLVANLTESAINEFQDDYKLKTLKCLPEYQNYATETRMEHWHEQLDWLRFRTFRYLGRMTGLKVVEFGSRWKGWSELLRNSDYTSQYTLRNSILNDCFSDDEINQQADVILAIDYLQQVVTPETFFDEVNDLLCNKGLLFIGIKVGSGFDVLTLKGNNKNIYPYEHNMMPTKKGLEVLLESKGYELLEFTTPGNFDVNYVKANLDSIDSEEHFLRYFFETSTYQSEAEFQRFIQKSGLSSYAQLVVRKR